MITENGYPVVMSLSLRTKPNGGLWTGEEFFGEYRDMESLSAAINKLASREIRLGWEIHVDFQDDLAYCQDPLA